MQEILDWSEVSKTYMPNFLIGNGLGRTYCEKFSYHSLLQIIGDGQVGRYKCTRDLFAKLKTDNFEEVLRAIFHAHQVSFDNQNGIKTLYLDVRKALISAINSIHPKFSEVPSHKIGKCLAFYENIFTTNYDLLPYWAILSGWSDVIVDYFWDGVFNPQKVKVYPGKRPIHFLHGALHLQSEGISDAKKVSLQVDSGVEGAIDLRFAEQFPLFISEGKSALKLDRIRGNSYLNFCYEMLCQSEGGLVIYGHDLNSEYDGHIVDALRMSRNRQIAVSVFTRLDDAMKERFMHHVLAQFTGVEIEIMFFESASHPIAQCNA